MGKKGNDLSKSARLELILIILEAYGQGEGITTAEIYQLSSQHFSGISKRTLFRDLIDLSSKVPLTDTVVDGKRRWFLSKQKGSSLAEQYRMEILRFLRRETPAET